MLSVALDGYALSDGSQYRGIGTYLRHLIAGINDRVDLTVMAVESVQLPAGVTHHVVRRRLPSRLRSREHDYMLPREVRRTGAAMLHVPAHRPGRPSPVPWVHTVHDLTPLVFRHALLERDRRQWVAAGPRLREAAAVVCVSRSTAEQVTRTFGVDVQRVHVAPLGVTSEFRPDGPRPERSPYVLWVSAWGPHKGLEDALSVVAGLADLGYPHRLLVAGRQDAWMAEQVRAAIARSPRPDRVDVLGHVADMPTLYRGAAAVVVSSRAEGFGLPALEAMACGAPVIAYANTSLPEVVGDGGLLVDDGDVPGLLAATRRALDDPALRSDLAAAAVSHAKAFTWERTVAAHLDAYAAASAG